MSTRATIWIKSEGQDDAFIYHHCDGYMLDEEIDPVLKELAPHSWNVPDVINRILEIEDTYSLTDHVGWDSEYVYKIDVDARVMEKYDCGIDCSANDDCKEEKTQAKYLEATFEYMKEKHDIGYLHKESQFSEEKQIPTDTVYDKKLKDFQDKTTRLFNGETMSQIVKIQIFDIVKFCMKIIESGYVMGADVNKIQEMFNIVHDNGDNSLQ